MIEDRARGDRATRSRAAAPRDVILLAGKGHEDYQEIAGVQARRSPTCVEARAALARRAGVAA